MTHIVNFKTKKELKEAMAQGESVYFNDPSLFDPCSGTAEQILEKKNSFTVTNHPRRSWFASITRDKKGSIKVS